MIHVSDSFEEEMPEINLLKYIMQGVHSRMAHLFQLILQPTDSPFMVLLRIHYS